MTRVAFLKLMTLVALSLTIQACSYTFKRAETYEGDKIWVKHYKDPEVAKIKREQAVFTYNTENPYLKYKGQIIVDTINSSTFIQFDSVRVYLFNNTAKYKSIFTSGLVSGQMIYCTLDSNCKPVKPPIRTYAETGDTLIADLWGWSGHTITIDYFELLNDVNSKPTQRRFKFWVHPYIIRMNGGNAIFFLELTNENANDSTDIETFIKGSKVTLIKNPWQMM